MLSEGGRPLKHWEYLAGPEAGGGQLGPPVWAGTGDFPYTNGGNARSVMFSAAAPPPGVVGAPYGYSFVASGTPSPTFTLESGSLPPGMTLDQGGVLSGTPQTSGTYSFVVKASNSDGPGTLTEALTLTVGVAPTVKKISPKKGAVAGGSSVKITGAAFTGATNVMFGSAQASSFVVNSPTSITAVAPAGAGTVDVTVTTTSGASGVSSKDRYTYEPEPLTVTGVTPGTGPIAGGTTVTVTGSGFALGNATTFTFSGKEAATAVNCASTTTCTLITPAAKKAGTISVIAAVGKTKSKKSSPGDQFIYG
jgi:hypothetical protein